MPLVQRAQEQPDGRRQPSPILWPPAPQPDNIQATGEAEDVLQGENSGPSCLHADHPPGCKMCARRPTTTRLRVCARVQSIRGRLTVL